MSERWIAGVIVLVIVGPIFFGMFVAWRKRQRAAAAFDSFVATPSAFSESAVRADVFYVATTRHGQPLERLAIANLTYRGRALLELADLGLQLSVRGSASVFIPREDIRSIDTAQVAIDKVVEPGGLVRIAWNLGPEIVDTYLRVSNAKTKAMLLQNDTHKTSEFASRERTS